MSNDKSISSSDVSVSSSGGFDPLEDDEGGNSTRLVVRHVFQGLRARDDPEAAQAAEQLRAVPDVHEQYERALVLARRFDIDVPGVLR